MNENEPREALPAEVVAPSAIEVHKAESPGVAVSNKAERIIVVAKNAEEMGEAQKKLIAWADAKTKEVAIEVEEAKKNLEVFKEKKWRTEPLKRVVQKAEKMHTYYTKVKAALEAGYVIIPNMPDFAFDVFAVRTTKKNPSKNLTSSPERSGNRWPDDQKTDSPPVGEGKYVSPDAVLDSEKILTKHEPGKNPEYSIERWAEEFKDVDFPFKLAKTQVLEDTAQAMKLGIFDEMIATPAFRRSRPKGDPMVMGRIIHRSGYQTKAVTFLVTWFVDSKDL